MWHCQVALYNQNRMEAIHRESLSTAKHLLFFSALSEKVPIGGLFLKCSHSVNFKVRFNIRAIKLPVMRMTSLRESKPLDSKRSIASINREKSSSAVQEVELTINSNCLQSISLKASILSSSEAKN
jgi:hypothetical protein